MLGSKRSFVESRSSLSLLPIVANNKATTNQRQGKFAAIFGRKSLSNRNDGEEEEEEEEEGQKKIHRNFP